MISILILILIAIISLNMSVERKKQRMEAIKKLNKKQRIQKRNDILSGNYEKYLRKQKVDREKTIIELILRK